VSTYEKDQTDKTISAINLIIMLAKLIFKHGNKNICSVSMGRSERIGDIYYDSDLDYFYIDE
jgi:hypothetical protein